MNMFARFDENPAMTLQVIKKKSYGRTDARTHGQRENSISRKQKKTTFSGQKSIGRIILKHSIRILKELGV